MREGRGVWESIAFTLTLSMCMSVCLWGGGIHVHWAWAPSVYANYCNSSICTCTAIYVIRVLQNNVIILCTINACRTV